MNKGKLCFERERKKKKNSTNTFQLKRCICTAIARERGCQPCSPAEPYKLLTNTECNVLAEGSPGRLGLALFSTGTSMKFKNNLTMMRIWLVFLCCCCSRAAGNLKRFFCFWKISPLPVPSPPPPHLCPGRSEELPRPKARCR